MGFVAIYWKPLYTYAYENTRLSLRAKLRNLLLILMVGVSLTSKSHMVQVYLTFGVALNSPLQHFP